MIEQYFRPGVRLLWTKPMDAMGPLSGDVVPSTLAATPMNYDGLDGHREVVDSQLLLEQAGNVLGLAMGGNIAHAWLAYAPGRTARMAAGGADILTGYMSGCLIARGSHNGAINVYHVGTIDGNVAVNQNVKRTFAASLPADATGFNPAGAWNHGEIAAIQAKLGGGNVATPNILALVTSGGAFYSVLLFNVSEANAWNNPAGRRYWCVGGKKLVPALNRVNLLASLNR